MFDIEQLPLLASLAEGTSPDAVHSLTKGAYESLDSPYSEAAAFLLGSSDERWNRTYKARSTDAATALGIGSYNTFRDRKTKDGLSHHDRLLLRVAEALTNDSPASTPTPSRTGWLGLGALVGTALLALLLAGLLSTRATPQQAHIGFPIENCDRPIAGASVPLEMTADLAEMMFDEYLAQGGRSALGCPAQNTQRWEELWLQLFIGGEVHPRSYLVGGSDLDKAYLVQFAVGEAYRNEIDGRLQAQAGLPVGVETMADHQVLRLSKGDLIVAHSATGPAFWIPAAAASVWEESGGPTGELGIPMTKVRYSEGGPYQEYERGTISEGEPLQGKLTAIEQARIDAYIRELGDFDNGIIRSSDGTAWWIEEGVRHWIPDGGVWNCLGGDSVVLDYEAPGWAIGDFAPGPDAACA